MNSTHQKHAKLARPALGEWGRSEIALLGAPCELIRAFAERVAEHLTPQWPVAFADADHTESSAAFANGRAIHFTDKISFKRLDIPAGLSSFQNHSLFSDCSLVLVNGNHFTAKQQIVFVHPSKPLAAKVAQLSDVQLVIRAAGETLLPDYLESVTGSAPVLDIDDEAGIFSFFEQYLQQHIAPLNGLVLAGGKSERMGADKGLLSYHGKPQREHLYELLKPVCADVYVSCNTAQSDGITVPKIDDRFLGIGPVGGLLSAFQQAPDAAWLTVACDMPYLSRKTLDYLVAHRNPAKLATAFLNADTTFPEPLITIWEPRAYPVLLQALGEGISCPRKVLIQSDVAILHAPDSVELHNVNDPASYNQAVLNLKAPAPKSSF